MAPNRPSIDPLRPRIPGLRTLNPARAWEIFSSSARTRRAMGWRGEPRRPAASPRPPGSRSGSGKA